MAAYPTDRLYSNQHLWLIADTGVIGVTRFAADELGDIIYIELPEVGATLSQSASFGVIESSKAVSDLYSPVSGTVVSVNEVLRDEPGLLNTDPFSAGWIAKLELSDLSELDQLIPAQAYEADSTG